MTWVLAVWILTTSGVEVERTRWPTLEACLAHRTTVEWRRPDRPDGTGTLLGACRPVLPRRGKIPL